MRTGFLILAALLALTALPARPPQADAPLTRDQVMDLVKFGMSSADLARRIRDRGIDFAPTEDDVAALRAAGAKEPVIQALQQAAPRPLTREQVGKLVAAGIPSGRAAELVKERGIAFQADETFLATLRLAGADDRLIAAVREASAAAPVELVVVTSPQADVSLDGRPAGHADAHGQLAIKAKPGAHVVRVVLAGKKPFEQNVTFVAGQTARLEATLAAGESVAGTPHETSLCLLIESATTYWQPLSIAMRALQQSTLIHPDTWVAAISYDQGPKILTDFGRGPGPVNAGLAALAGPGSNQANLNDAVAFVLDRMKAVRGSKAVILISSGLDTSSQLDDVGLYAAAQAADVPVYAISIAGLLDPVTQASWNFARAKTKLDFLANLTKGRSYFPQSESEFSSVSSEIGAMVNGGAGAGAGGEAASKPVPAQNDTPGQEGFEPGGQWRDVGGVDYVPPAGWSAEQWGSAVVMTGPAPQGYQPCMLVIDPTVTPSGDMAAQLEVIVNNRFGRQLGPYHGESGGDLKADQSQGRAVAGWPYVDLLGQLGNSGLHVRALLARFNERAVAVMGLFSMQWSGGGPLPPHAGELASNCLGSNFVRDNDVFLMLFHSLRLPGFRGTSPELAKQLLGSWESVTSTAGVRVTYAANGHFDDGAVKANYYLSGSGVIYDVASNFAGDGTYRLDGDRLTMTRNGGKSRTLLVSVVRRQRRDRPGEYDEILRLVEPADNQVWGFGRTGYYVMSYHRSH